MECILRTFVVSAFCSIAAKAVCQSPVWRYDPSLADAGCLHNAAPSIVLVGILIRVDALLVRGRSDCLELVLVHIRFQRQAISVTHARMRVAIGAERAVRHKCNIMGSEVVAHHRIDVTRVQRGRLLLEICRILHSIRLLLSGGTA
jgi:hypothetical protein